MGIKTAALQLTTSPGAGKVWTSDADGVGSWVSPTVGDVVIYHAAMTDNSTVTISSLDGDTIKEIEITFQGNAKNPGSADWVLEMRPNADNASASYYQMGVYIDNGTRNNGSSETVTGLTIARGFGGGSYTQTGIIAKARFCMHQNGTYRGFMSEFYYIHSNGPKNIQQNKWGVWKGSGNITSLSFVWQTAPNTVSGFLTIRKKSV